MRKALPITALALMLCAACTSSSEGNDTIMEADAIYNEQKQLLKAYADSFRRLPDSASSERLMSDLEEKLYQVTRKYSSYATASLDGDQNDTLYMLTRRLVEASRPKAAPDSSAHAADSVTAGKKEEKAVKNIKE